LQIKIYGFRPRRIVTELVVLRDAKLLIVFADLVGIGSQGRGGVSAAGGCRGRHGVRITRRRGGGRSQIDWLRGSLEVWDLLMNALHNDQHFF